MNFIKLRDEFTKYLKQNFNDLDISKIIDFESFINEYYKKSPIKNNHFARTYLNEDFEIDDPYLSL